MFKQIYKVYRAHTMMVEVEDNIRTMIRLAKEIYTASSLALLEQKNVEFDLYARDREINMLVVEIRKKIVEHLAITADHNVGGELVFIKVINDIERVGDYSKNLLDLAQLLPEPLSDGCYYEKCKDLFPKVASFFDMAEKALFESSEEDANDVIGGHLSINQACEEILTSLMQDPAIHSHEAIAYALTARYYKRVSSHLKNVASTAVNPFSHIGYMKTPLVEDASEENP
jgi:phosphate uptake regulator